MPDAALGRFLLSVWSHIGLPHIHHAQAAALLHHGWKFPEILSLLQAAANPIGASGPLMHRLGTQWLDWRWKDRMTTRLGSNTEIRMCGHPTLDSPYASPISDAQRRSISGSALAAPVKAASLKALILCRGQVVDHNLMSEQAVAYRRRGLHQLAQANPRPRHAIIGQA
jgi:hypothetical protein